MSWMLHLDAVIVAEGVGVGGKVPLLLLVVGVVVRNEMTGVGVAAVEITHEVNDKFVESVVKSVTVVRSLNCHVWIHCIKE
jgi:hypothetical protein